MRKVHPSSSLLLFIVGIFLLFLPLERTGVLSLDYVLFVAMGDVISSHLDEGKRETITGE